MTTDTGKIREAFESEHYVGNLNLRKTDGKYGDRVVQGMWRSYLSAYNRGQRDLIESLEQYTTIMKDGTPLYRLPEETPK